MRAPHGAARLVSSAALLVLAVACADRSAPADERTAAAPAASASEPTKSAEAPSLPPHDPGPADRIAQPVSQPTSTAGPVTTARVHERSGDVDDVTVADGKAGVKVLLGLDGATTKDTGGLAGDDSEIRLDGNMGWDKKGKKAKRGEFSKKTRSLGGETPKIVSLTSPDPAVAVPPPVVHEVVPDPDKAADTDGRFTLRTLKKEKEREEADKGRQKSDTWRYQADREKKNEEVSEQPEQPSKPAQFLPRTFYFENTYLGGNAAYAERLRRLDQSLADGPHRLASVGTQLFDPPARAGIALTASLSRRWVDKPGRVYLQVGLQGSRRFGWRRPPLELVLVIDGSACARSADAVRELVEATLQRLGTQDRVAVLLSGGDAPVPTLSSVREAQMGLAAELASGASDPRTLRRTLAQAGRLLGSAARSRRTLPGTQIVLLVTGEGRSSAVRVAARSAHRLALAGVVTSVIELGASQTGVWWRVASEGHGSYHRVAPERPVAAAVEAELGSLSRVVARLLRINIRLAPGVQAIRVLGSRPLDAAAVRRVKAREVATDASLSASLGIGSDRGAVDDGIQTGIPYFFGGDAHVVLVELWVEHAGPVADVTLRYKDMVNLTNATARTSAELRNVPREPGVVQATVLRNVRGADLAHALQSAADAVLRGDVPAALQLLGAAAGAAPEARDAEMLGAFLRLVRDEGSDVSRRAVLGEALALAARRKVGEPGTPGDGG